MIEPKRVHLTTPALDSIKHPDTLIKAQAVRDWADNLPYANPSRMANEVLSSLKRLNRHPDRIPQRTNIMAIYMDLFRKIMDMVQKIICQNNNNWSANKNNQELITLAETMCSEMAYGFKLIINSELIYDIKVPPNMRAEHIHFAIVSLSFSLILNMTAYRPESHTAWREIFQLLAMAQQLGVANLEITTATSEAGYEVSVLNSFKSILLISILNPSRLTPREIWGAYNYLSWHAKSSRITSIEQASQRPGNYLIAMDGIKKPTLFDPKKPPQTPGKHMVLETHGLNILISKHLDILSDDNTVPVKGCEKLNHGIKTHLLKQMLHIWHANPTRRHERNDRFDRVACAFGVSSAYQFLKQGNIGQPNQAPEIEEELSLNHNIYECRQENISASGMMIISSDQIIEKLKIGQIIVTQSMIGGETKPLTIGVIRRISNQNQSSTEFGVQFIPGNLFAATALPEVFGRKHGADVQPCVALDLGKNKPKALITTNLIYHAGQHYIVDISGKSTKRVIAGRLLESTACFDCFEYNVLEHC